MKLNYMIFYHANCIDGITAATVTTKYIIDKLQGEAEHIHLLAVHYDDDLESLRGLMLKEKIDVLFIVDFSFTRGELAILAKVVTEINLFDHHASAFRNLMGENYEITPVSWEDFYLPVDVDGEEEDSNIHITLDNDECGASLCYKHMLGDSVPDEEQLPKLIKFVKDYDLYRFKYPETKAVNKFLKQQSKDLATYTALLIAFDDDYFLNPCIREGRTLITYEESIENKLLADGTTPITINGVKGLCVNAPYEFASSLGHKLALESKTFGATWSQLAHGKAVFSLRSNGDECDVSKLAELMQGGGHKNAAGFTLGTPQFNEESGITLWSESAKEAGRNMAGSVEEAIARTEEDAASGD